MTPAVETKDKQHWRRALSRPLQVAILLGVFVAGGIVGAVGAVWSVHARIEQHRQHPERLPDRVLPRLNHRLGLSDDQARQVSTIFRLHHARIVSLHGEVSGSIHDEFAAMERNVGAVLDDEQRQLWTKSAARVRTTFLPPLRTAARRGNR